MYKKYNSEDKYTWDHMNELNNKTFTELNKSKYPIFAEYSI